MLNKRNAPDGQHQITPDSLSDITKRLRTRESQTNTGSDFVSTTARDMKIMEMIKNSINNMIDIYQKLVIGEESPAHLIESMKKVCQDLSQKNDVNEYLIFIMEYFMNQTVECSFRKKILEMCLKMSFGDFNKTQQNNLQNLFTEMYLQAQVFVQNDVEFKEIPENQLLNFQILLIFTKKFWTILEIPETGALFSQPSNSVKVQGLIIFCLSLDPNTSILRPIRSKALSLLLSSDQSHDFTSQLLENLLNDQDKFMRLKVIKKITNDAANNPELVRKICNNGENESDLQIRQNIMRLMVISLNQGQKANVKEIVLIICKQIRIAMDKNMRIFCANLLTEIQSIDEEIVVQMMAKEEFTFNQRFTQIGSVQDQILQKKLNQDQMQRKQASQSKKKAQTEEELYHHHVQGILLLLLEDDSMTLRLAGIKAMSVFARKCPKIRIQCLRFLIDMLNDEIDEVRIGALHGIERFNEVLTLNDYEVETVLFNLNEDNIKLRREIYLFFGEVIIDRNLLFIKLIQSLMTNLVKYLDQDQHMIFDLMKKLGKSHSKLVTNIYHKILEVDKRFLAKEPDQNDPSYVAKIILISSAAMNENPGMKITETLECPPFYLEKHLDYLKDKYCKYLENDSKRRARADSLNISQANQSLLTKIMNLLCSNSKDSLKQVMQLTKNSLTQLINMTNHNNLIEITHNQIDQSLGFTHLLAKIMYLAKNSNKQIKGILQAKLQIDAHFILSNPISVFINQQLSSIFINLLKIFLKNSLTQSIFDQNRFIRAIQNLCKFLRVNQLEDLALQLKAEILDQPILEICKPQFREKLLSKISQIQNPKQDIQKQMLRDIDCIKFCCSHISRGSTLDCDQALVFNSRFLEFLTLKINKIVTSDFSSLCILYPNEKVHFERLLHSELGVQNITKQVQLQMNCESWSSEAHIQLFQIKEEPQTDEMWQIITDLVGDVYANILLQTNDKNGFQNYYRVIEGKKLVLINSNVQQMLIKPI